MLCVSVCVGVCAPPSASPETRRWWQHTFIKRGGSGFSPPGFTDSCQFGEGLLHWLYINIHSDSHIPLHIYLPSTFTYPSTRRPLQCVCERWVTVRIDCAATTSAPPVYPNVQVEGYVKVDASCTAAAVWIEFLTVWWQEKADDRPAQLEVQQHHPDDGSKASVCSAFSCFWTPQLRSVPLSSPAMFT